MGWDINIIFNVVIGHKKCLKNVLNDQAISIHSAHKMFIVSEHFHTEILQLQGTTWENMFTFWKQLPSCLMVLNKHMLPCNAWIIRWYYENGCYFIVLTTDLQLFCNTGRAALKRKYWNEWMNGKKLFGLQTLHWSCKFLSEGLNTGPPLLSSAPLNNHHELK